MKVLVDTNVLIDYLSGREPYYDKADAVIRFCRDGIILGVMAAHSVTNIFYILRKNHDDVTSRLLVKSLFSIIPAIEIDNDKLLSALNRSDFKDFEDCLQEECAVAFNADYIITRNIKDFEHSRIPALTPTEFLEMIHDASHDSE